MAADVVFDSEPLFDANSTGARDVDLDGSTAQTCAKSVALVALQCMHVRGGVASSRARPAPPQPKKP